MALATAPKCFMSAAMLRLKLLMVMSSLHFTVSQIGVNYGRMGNNLPPPSRVIELFKQYNIQRIRIYDNSPDILEALRCSDIELTMGISHEDLEHLATSSAYAQDWVNTSILAYYPDVNFKHITVGNEIDPHDPSTSWLAPFVLPAMENLYSAISEAPDIPDGAIKLTINVRGDILEPGSSYPPQNGTFRADVCSYIDPIIRFLSDTDAPLFASVYPYFAYANDPTHMDKRYALLDPDYPGLVLGGVLYKNLFYAMVDSVNAAVEKSLARSSPLADVDAGSGNTPRVSSGETGHPTAGGGPPPPPWATTSSKGEDDWANTENAREYINNLIQAVKGGTPKNPDQPIETYIFAMFDENQKPGNESERHFGMFLPNGKPKYPVNFN